MPEDTARRLAEKVEILRRSTTTGRVLHEASIRVLFEYIDALTAERDALVAAQHVEATLIEYGVRMPHPCSGTYVEPVGRSFVEAKRLAEPDSNWVVVARSVTCGHWVDPWEATGFSTSAVTDGPLPSTGADLIFGKPDR